MLAVLVALVIAPPTVETDVVYAEVGRERLLMDIHKPSGISRAKPAVVVIHGGGWVSGSRREVGPIAESLARRGAVAFSPQYRLAPKHRWPAMFEDVRTAVRFVRANAARYGVDPNRIGVAGISAGGQLALMLGTVEDTTTSGGMYPDVSSKVSAVLDYFGPTDMSLLPDNLLVDAMIQMVLGKQRKKADAEMREASPVSHLSRGDAPIFAVHGTADTIVDIVHTRALEARAKRIGVPIQAIYVEGMKHGFGENTEVVQHALRTSLDWLVAELRR